MRVTRCRSFDLLLISLKIWRFHAASHCASN